MLEAKISNTRSGIETRITGTWNKEEGKMKYEMKYGCYMGMGENEEEKRKQRGRYGDCGKW